MSIGLSVAHCDWEGIRVNSSTRRGSRTSPARWSRDWRSRTLRCWSSRHRYGAGRSGDGLGDDPGGRCPRADRREPHGQGERGVRGDCRRASRGVRAQAIAVTVPIGAADGFSGYIDLVDDRAHAFDDRGRATDTPVPDALSSEIERAHAASSMPPPRVTTRCLRSTSKAPSSPTTRCERLFMPRRHRDAGADRLRRCGVGEGRRDVLDSIVRYLPRRPSALVSRSIPRAAR